MRIYFVFLLLGWLCSSLYPADNITNVRTSFSKGKQRVVIDIDGNDEPAYYVRKGKNEIDLTIERITSPDKAESFASLLSGANYIQKASFIILPDEKETIINIEINDKVSDDIFSLAGPSRVVIDLEKTRPVKGDK